MKPTNDPWGWSERITVLAIGVLFLLMLFAFVRGADAGAVGCTKATVTGVTLTDVHCLFGRCGAAFSAMVRGESYVGTVNGWGLDDGDVVNITAKFCSGSGYASGARVTR